MSLSGRKIKMSLLLLSPGECRVFLKSAVVISQRMFKSLEKNKDNGKDGKFNKLQKCTILLPARTYVSSYRLTTADLRRRNL